jgi:hypothetical protein
MNSLNIMQQCSLFLPPRWGAGEMALMLWLCKVMLLILMQFLEVGAVRAMKKPEAAWSPVVTSGSSIFMPRWPPGGPI